MVSNNNIGSRRRPKPTGLIVVPDQDLGGVLDSTVLSALRPLTAILTGIFVVFIIFNLLDLPPHAVTPVVAWDIVLVLCFAGLRLALAKELVPARWAHPVLAAVAALVVSNILLAMYLLSEPLYTTYLLIVALGGGYFLLSARWGVALGLGLLGAWAAVASQAATPKQFLHYGVMLAVTITLAVVIHVVRIRTIRRLERLQLITQRRKEELEQALGDAEHELAERQQAEARYRHLVQGIEGIVWEADARTGQMTFVSDHAAQVLGHPTDAWLSSAEAWLDLVHPEDRDGVRGLFRGWQAGEHGRELELRAVRDDGEPVWLRMSAGLVRDASGAPRQLRGLMVDITERRQEERRSKELEAQLLQAQKMESIGRLAGGVAHDMNNMLAAIMNLASALQEDLDPASPLRQDADDILKACNRGRSLTQNLLGFARRGKYRKARVNLNDVVVEVVELLARTLSKRVEVRQLLERELADVEGDPNQLQQALVNLALNAADAMEGAGTLTFATELVQLRDDDLPSTPSLAAGSYVELRVSDTGVGMDEETLRSAFEPFFTTKQPGEGTGLGLSMVYGTVRSHSGQVLIESAPGAGTTVTIRFPALLPAAEVLAEPEQPAEQLHRGAGTILVVDDEELVRKSTRLLLERLGYTVLLAEDGPTALERYRTDGAAVDLVLLDLLMPGMDGRETFRELQALDPAVRVLFASGYADDDAVRELTAACGAPLMPKPYDLRQLAAAVAGAMQDAPRPVKRSSAAPSR